MTTFRNRRRPRGSGSIRANKRGTGYLVRYTNEQGRQVSAGITFPTRRAAELWLAERLTQVARGDWIDPRAASVPFGQYGVDVMAVRRRTPRSREEFTRIWTNYVVPCLGAVPVNRVTAALVRRWYADLEGRTGAATRRQAYSMVHAVLNAAVEERLIARNPGKIKGANDPVGGTRPYFSHLDVERIAAHMREHLRPLALITGWTGMRVGEVIALCWEDVDLGEQAGTGGRLHVHRQLAHVRGQAFETAPKAMSYRVIPIPVEAADVLRAHRDSVGVVAPSARVFVNIAGEELTRHAVGQAWRKARAKAGLSQYCFHDVRHSAATLAAQAGATTRELQDRLGHSTVRAAMNYQQVAAERAPLIADLMAEAVRAERLRRRGEGQPDPG